MWHPFKTHHFISNLKSNIVRTFPYIFWLEGLFFDICVRLRLSKVSRHHNQSSTFFHLSLTLSLLTFSLLPALCIVIVANGGKKMAGIFYIKYTIWGQIFLLWLPLHRFYHFFSLLFHLLLSWWRMNASWFLKFHREEFHYTEEDAMIK